MQLERPDLDALHDVVLSAMGFDEVHLTDEQILVWWNKLPRDLQLDAEKWGISDTVVRDSIYVWLQKNINLE